MSAAVDGMDAVQDLKKGNLYGAEEKIGIAASEGIQAGKDGIELYKMDSEDTK